MEGLAGKKGEGQRSYHFRITFWCTAGHGLHLPMWFIVFYVGFMGKRRLIHTVTEEQTDMTVGCNIRLAII